MEKQIVHCACCTCFMPKQSFKKILDCKIPIDIPVHNVNLKLFMMVQRGTACPLFCFVNIKSIKMILLFDFPPKTLWGVFLALAGFRKLLPVYLHPLFARCLEGGVLGHGRQVDDFVHEAERMVGID